MSRLNYFVLACSIAFLIEDTFAMTGAIQTYQINRHGSDRLAPSAKRVFQRS